MATKTITLELDAYEKLRRAKRGKESFSAVVRRGRFDDETCTGEAILNELRGIYRAKRRSLPKKTETYWERVEAEEAADPRISPSEWDA